MATPSAELPSRPAPAQAIQLKTPKGTRDLFGEPAKLRRQIFQKLITIFECHGAQELDTPVFELREILSDQYGEDSKLIYDLEDQGGEICSLRYDLTVPFARWLAMQTNVTQVSRYHIAKVYRRDQPAMTRGRYREFYQCDFDIAGEYESMIPDAEVLLVAVEAFEALGIEITVKLNHRGILNGIFTVAGVPAEKIKTISSAVDKLDKMAWEEVKQEMVEQKGLAEDVADEVGRLVRNHGTMREMLAFLKSDAKLMENDSIKAGVADMTLLATYLEAYNIADKISFDISLARGLDYYTGLIYEVVAALPPNDPTTSKSSKKTQEAQVGSIAAGGRYDEMVGKYAGGSSKDGKKAKRKIPCIGISFGVERIFTILESRLKATKDGKDKGISSPEFDVYIAAAGNKENGLLAERMAVLGQLTRAGIRATFLRKTNPKLVQQFQQQTNLGVPIAVILGLGEDEIAAGNVRLKVSQEHGQGEKEKVDAGAEEKVAPKDPKGQLVPRDDLVREVRALMQQLR